MELYDHDFLEELFSLRRETCSEEENHHHNNLFSSSSSNNNGWSSNSFDSSFDQNSPHYSSLVQNSSYNCQQVPQINHNYNNDHHYTFNEIYCSLLEEFSAPQIIDHSSTPPSSFLAQEDNNNYYCDPFSMNLEEEDNPSGLFGEEELQNTTSVCKVEQSQSPEDLVPIFNSNTNSTICMERKNRAKKMMIQGQPSKNLMAERRRRKRLNDRLSMLRSIVPKISKMDRTSILGDTIDYMKELLEKINSLKQEIEVDSNGIFNDVKPNEMLVRNSPKFDVERRNGNTRVEICCGAKPGLLLSTVNTLEALGLEIQQCVISCFNDFTMQASCSEELEHKTILSPEDIKQALFRSAGYGGRCL